jgi:hydroxymethylpyrimidine kinase/phosphomethylpyrimidine kinase/thiamine-phosphate diphosphorylase
LAAGGLRLNHVCTIAGLDNQGLSGVAADCKAFTSLNVPFTTIFTAVTSQNPQGVQAIDFISTQQLAEQLQVLKKTKPAAIKIGMVGSIFTLEILHKFLQDYHGWVILDPILHASSGGNLFTGNLLNYLEHLRRLISRVDVLTPNLREAEVLLNRNLRNYQDLQLAARELLKLGAKSVFLKGGHISDAKFSQDYWTDGKQAFWLATPRRRGKKFRATGCTLSSAIAAALAKEYTVRDSIVIAKMFTQQCIRLAKPLNPQQHRLSYAGWPECEMDIPLVSPNPIRDLPLPFPAPGKLGLYPIVNSSIWVAKLLTCGVKTLQLRIKEILSFSTLQQEIQISIQLAKRHKANLYINDHWQLAQEFNAFGVHLGQEDLNTADLISLQKIGIRLGISTHSYYEVARAHAISPSYMACGPIFPTTSKVMPFSPQGIESLKRWRRSLSYPLVAIGGIHAGNLGQILRTGVDGAALISAITQSLDPQRSTQRLLEITQREISHVITS